MVGCGHDTFDNGEIDDNGKVGVWHDNGRIGVWYTWQW